MKRWHQFFIVFCFCALGCLHYFSLLHRGLTPDENTHFNYGKKILNANPQRIEAGEVSTMPFSALNAALPKIINQETVQAGRWATVLCSFILVIIVFFWAKELYGIYSGLVALLMCCFDPNILAHGQLVTTDLFSALMMTLSSYLLWRFHHFGGFTRGLWCAIVTGIALLSKYTCIVLYPLFLVLTTCFYLPLFWKEFQNKQYKMILKHIKQFFAYAFLFLALGLIAINIGFCFYKTGTPLANYTFETKPFKQLQDLPIAQWPLPLPTPYLHGLDMINYDDITGNIWNIYLNGHVKHAGHGKGFKGYFNWVLLYKTPLALLVLFFIALPICFKRGFTSFMRNEIFLLLPIVFFLTYYNLGTSLQVGIRSILFLLPPAWILTSSLFSNWPSLTLRFKKVLLLSLFLFVISSLSYFPHFVSYFNELTPDRKLAYEKLADSNLDWGGLDWYVDKYRQQHPDIKFEYPSPKPGHFLIGATDLVGIYDIEKHRWLRENFKPIDTIAYAILVYHITPEDIQQLYQKMHLK